MRERKIGRKKKREKVKMKSLTNVLPREREIEEEKGERKLHRNREKR